MGKDQVVAILDAGAQYGKLIDRRIRELNVETELLPLGSTVDELKGYGAIVISGGPGSVYAQDAPTFDGRILDLGLPVLGVCYGFQLIVHVLGGRVEATEARADRPATIRVDTASPIFDGLSEHQTVLLTHGDAATSLPSCLQAVAQAGERIVGISHSSLPLYGTQFHPEVDLSEEGVAMFSNFLLKIAGLAGSYTRKNRHAAALDYIRTHVGPDNSVLSLVSGGVDSTVCTALLVEALGARRVCAVHVDNGFMRFEESILVCKALGETGLDVQCVDASETFANATLETGGLPLCQMIDPESKRHIIGDTFMHVMTGALNANNLDLDRAVLAQGTLRPDLIESGSHLASGSADVIKTHHNDTPLVRQMRARGKVIEPLKDFHKDEVRELGADLGLPRKLLWRHPFPGPGLAIRVICTDGSPRSTAPSESDDLMLKQMVEQHMGASVRCNFLQCASVGVQGDKRTYKNAAVLFLDGGGAPPRWEQLVNAARDIPSKVHCVNRVLWAFRDASKGELTPTTLVPAVIEQVRLADAAATNVLQRHGCMDRLAQMPIQVVLIPVSYSGVHADGLRSVVLRPFVSRDFMTGLPGIPGEHIPPEAATEMVERVGECKGISNVLWDCTSKPPGTTEWE